MINRLIDSSSGTIKVNGRDIKSINPVDLRRSIGYVFQGVGLFPHMTIEQNIELVPRFLGWSVKERKNRTNELLGLVDLPAKEYRDRFPELKDTLILLSNKIDNTAMQRLNYAADGKGHSPARVANDFLRSAGLLDK